MSYTVFNMYMSRRSNSGTSINSVVVNVYWSWCWVLGSNPSGDTFFGLVNFFGNFYPKLDFYLMCLGAFTLRMISLFSLDYPSELISLEWLYVASTHVHLFIWKNKQAESSMWMKGSSHEDVQLGCWSSPFDETAKKSIEEERMILADQLHSAHHTHVHTMFILGWSS